jgi:predicted nucleotidyltransferase
MSSLVYETSESHFSQERLQSILQELQRKLAGRVSAAYIFGSASTGEISKDSDIDLILVQENPTEPFVRRPFEFLDLLEIFSRIDMLVYSPQELARQLEDSQLGFWKSVRESLRQIL